MKKKQQQQQQEHLETNNNNEHELEIIKAVAQAWHSHSTSSNSSTSNEFDTLRLNFKNKPTRFKLEAINKLSSSNNVGASWDFGQSLWDSYEIVTMSKRLEAGLVLDHQFPDETTASGSYGKSKSSRKLESKNSLRNILNRVSSRRFDDS